MNKSIFLYTALSTIISQHIYAETPNRDPSQTNVNTSSAVSQKDLEKDVLRIKQLSDSNSTQNGTVVQYTGRQLVENPEILEDLFLQALISQNKNILPGYIKLYSYVENKDSSLLDWANAILLKDKNLNESISSYRKLVAHFPDNNFIRFQLAETLFFNQYFASAKEEFIRLKTTSNTLQDIEVFNNFIKAIDKQNEWNFSFGANFLNDKNLGNSAKVGTSMALPNGAKITYNSPRQKGQGIASWLSADKKWHLKNGKYIGLESSLSSKYYWDNKSYNDLNAHIGLGIGYNDSRFNIEVTPYIDKRWYAGGMNATNSLKQYSNTYGFSISPNYWLTQKLKYSLYYNYGYEKYDRASTNSQYGGAIQALTNSLIYFPSSTQYWSFALDLTKKEAKDSTNAYERIGSRLTWGQEWPLGFATSTTLGFANRNYKELTFFGTKQKNKEYSLSLSLWNNKFNYAGFTPRISFDYVKTDSNIAIYSYDKKQVSLNIIKSF